MARTNAGAADAQKTFQRTVRVDHPEKFGPGSVGNEYARAEFARLAAEEGLTLSDDVKVITSMTKAGSHTELTLFAHTAQGDLKTEE